MRVIVQRWRGSSASWGLEVLDVGGGAVVTPVVGLVADADPATQVRVPLQTTSGASGTAQAGDT